MLANRLREPAMKSGEVVSTMGTLTPSDWTQVIARTKLALELT
jgi:hypothetical protein